MVVVSFQRNITGNSILPAIGYAEKRVQRYYFFTKKADSGAVIFCRQAEI